MQDSTMLPTKRKSKDDADNESPESINTTGNGPRVQRPTPKNPNGNGAYSLANPGKNFEPSALSATNSSSP